MRIFLTGGAGFIGSAMCRHLLANSDDEVTCYDALTYAGNLSTIADLEPHKGFHFVKGDICDPEALREAMRGHDAVMHLAAESHVDRSIAGPHDFVQTNCFGTSMVMHTAHQLGIDRVVHVSTDEVYGSVETGSSSESDVLEPRSPYSASKAGSDLLALSWHTTYGMGVMVTRSSNNFGPYQFPEKLIPLFVTNLLEGKKVPVYGDGGNMRDWIYVADNCAALDFVLRNGEAGEIYNIGFGHEITNLDITHRILEACGASQDSIEHVTDRLGHDRRYSVDTTKMRALGWKPERDFPSALAETVQWYKDNRWWWEPLRIDA